MPSQTTHKSGPKIVDRYLDLVRAFPLISIKSDDQLAAAQTMIDKLLAMGKLNEGEELYLDALSDLVATFEDVHFPIAPASDADMLRHLLDNRGITQAELHRQTGIARSTISELLAGKKSFSKAMIRILADFFKVHTSVLTSNW
jgi:HTH-type transcriptional regulator/antitoxin HigA